MNQYRVEQEAGIDTQELADHISKAETPAAKNALSLLAIQCNRAEHGGMELLKCAVEDCKRELDSG